MEEIGERLGPPPVPFCPIELGREIPVRREVDQFQSFPGLRVNRAKKRPPHTHIHTLAFTYSCQGQKG
jgi:hypothetical protein